MWRGFDGSCRYSVNSVSERGRPNQVLRQNKNGISTMSHATTKMSQRARRERRFWRAVAAEGERAWEVAIEAVLTIVAHAEQVSSRVVAAERKGKERRQFQKRLSCGEGLRFTLRPLSEAEIRRSCATAFLKSALGASCCSMVRVNASRRRKPSIFSECPRRAESSERRSTASDSSYVLSGTGKGWPSLPPCAKPKRAGSRKRVGVP